MTAPLVITAIPMRHVTRAWPALWPLLEPATRLAPDRPDVRARLVAGHAQLWAVYQGDRPLAAIVTEITLLPEKRCRLWLVGGARLAEWAGDLLPKVEAWAAGLGCVALWGTQSRRGWTRLVKRFGGTAKDGAWERRIR